MQTEFPLTLQTLYRVHLFLLAAQRRFILKRTFLTVAVSAVALPMQLLF
jgi:hypothetical protein